MRLLSTITSSLSYAFVVIAGASYGQGVFNASNIYLQGAKMYVDGEVYNTGLMENKGLVAFTGDWKNPGTYTGYGTLEANGNAPQIMSHGDDAVHKLMINGWGTKYVDGAVAVSGELSMRRGIVEVTDGDLMVLLSGCVATGGSSDSYVDGPLTAEGKGYKFFPIGKNGTYAPIELLDVKGNAGRYSMEVFENAPVVSAEDVIVRRSLYWQRKDLLGAFGGSPVAIDYERRFFEDRDNIILLAGNSFDEPFAVISELDHSAETDKIITRNALSAFIIMLGEISDRWTDGDFYLPTALSPHAAFSENKTVKIFGERLSGSQFQFLVFDRWGDLVFESNSLEDMQSKGWDGRTLQGRELATGTYPYRLSAVDKAGKKFERKGIITVIN